MENIRNVSRTPVNDMRSPKEISAYFLVPCTLIVERRRGDIVQDECMASILMILYYSVGQKTQVTLMIDAHFPIRLVWEHFLRVIHRLFRRSLTAWLAVDVKTV